MSVDAPQRSRLWLGCLALLVLAMFADALWPGARMLGEARADMPYHTLPWRAFGFGELAKGNLALWNPYIFGGVPYFGGMQSALLYPPNLLFLALPLPLALNWSIALDLWLAGAFMFLWAKRRGLAPFAAFVCGALFMFCAPHFLRMQAGLVTQLASMAWAPLIFLCIDEWLGTRRRLWCLLGSRSTCTTPPSSPPSTAACGCSSRASEGWRRRACSACTPAARCSPRCSCCPACRRPRKRCAARRCPTSSRRASTFRRRA
jgi:hypothetical protein